MDDQEKFNIDFNHEHGRYELFFSDGVLINSKRFVEFEIINYNPIEV